MRDRIVVTAYGIKGPKIANIQDYKNVLEKGICVQELREDIGPNKTPLICGPIEDSIFETDTRYNRYPAISRLAIAATEEALKMSEIKPLPSEKINVILGTSLGGIVQTEYSSTFSQSDDYKKYPLLSVPQCNPHSLASSVSAHIHATGQSLTIASGCTASNDAILLGKMFLETNQADYCIVGGAEYAICRIVTYGFSKLRIQSKDVDFNKVGAPFSSESNSFVISDGAGILVLEKESHALKRGAKIYGVIDNGYSNNDSKSIFESDTSGNSMLDCLEHALNGTVPTYMSSQALGLKDNDTVEKYVHETLFQNSIPITSIKGMIGHTLGASGVMQVIAGLLSIEHNFIPPTIKTQKIGFEKMPIVTETLYTEVNNIGITSHGYGGNNNCLLISDYK